MPTNLSHLPPLCNQRRKRERAGGSHVSAVSKPRPAAGYTSAPRSQFPVFSFQFSVLGFQFAAPSSQRPVLSLPRDPARRAGHIEDGQIEPLFRKGISRILCLRNQAHRATHRPDRAWKGVSHDKASLEGVAAFSIPRVGRAGLRRVRLLVLAGAGHRPQ